MRFYEYYTKNCNFRTEYGKEVRKLRVLVLDISQADFAKRLGVSTGYVSQIELGKVLPTGELKNKIDNMMKING